MVGLRLLALAGLLSLETVGASAIFGVVIQDATSPRGLTAITATSPAPLQSYAALAWGMYNDTITTNGWSFLDVHTNASALYNDTQVGRFSTCSGVHAKISSVRHAQLRQCLRFLETSATYVEERD